MRAILAAGALGLALSVPAAAQSERAAESRPDIVDTAVAADGFDTLVAAVTAAELVELLKSNGPFTVLAPTDEAFAEIQGTVDTLLEPENQEALQDVLTYHVISGRYPSERIAAAANGATGVELEMANGEMINVSLVNGEVIVTDSAGTEHKVIATDINSANGVIHVIDGVLIPPMG